MLRKEPQHAGGTDSDDRVHRALALILGAVAGVVFWVREPAPPGFDGAAEKSAASRAEAPSGAAIEPAIAELARWFERAGSEPRTPLDANQRLLALGRGALEPGAGAATAALVWKNLEGLARPSAAARPASSPQIGNDPFERDASADATLAILLETGMPLDAELPLASGALSLRRLLELALPEPGARRDSADPWILDLLSFAVLAGMPERRSDLERQTLASLARLDREQRRITQLRRDGARGPAAVAAEWRHGDPGEWSRELQLGVAVFRAVAVLAEPDLEQRALRHLNALLVRHEVESDRRELALEHAQTPSQRVALQVAALEASGRLEQALYGAHLAFRRDDRPVPSPRAASSMRRAAAELLMQLEALKMSGAFAAQDARGALRTDELARAAAQALRGLRAARIAG